MFKPMIMTLTLLSTVFTASALADASPAKTLTPRAVESWLTEKTKDHSFSLKEVAGLGEIGFSTSVSMQSNNYCIFNINMMNRVLTADNVALLTNESAVISLDKLTLTHIEVVEELPAGGSTLDYTQTGAKLYFLSFEVASPGKLIDLAVWTPASDSATYVRSTRVVKRYALVFDDKIVAERTAKVLSQYDAMCGDQSDEF